MTSRRRPRGPAGGRGGTWEAGWVRITRRALAYWSVIATAALTLAAGCDSSLDRPALPTAGTVTTTPTTTTAPSITPVTPDGLVTGPGVTDGAITLGLLVDADRDRGFTQGVQLWQQAVNTSGGLCGRTVQLITNGGQGRSLDIVDAYDSVGRTAIGLITLPSLTESVALGTRISADQIPALTPSGPSAQLGPGRPIVLGPTDDILAINGLDYLVQSGRIGQGATVGVLTDGSADATNALKGARWWAKEQGVTLDVRQLASAGVPTDWGAATTVLALTDSPTTAGLAAGTLPGLLVLTTIDGYDPTSWSPGALGAAGDGRVLVSTAAPAYGSDYPAAVAVASRSAADGRPAPGPRLFDGYATGLAWARLLTQACGDRALTRQSVEQATATVGPASVDSLFGPSDPGLPVGSGLPATRVSAIATADPAAPGGLKPLTWLQAASGVENYVP